MLPVVHERSALEPLGQEVVQGWFALGVRFELGLVGVREVGAVLPLAVGRALGVAQAQQLLDFAELELYFPFVCLFVCLFVAIEAKQVD